MVLFFGFVFSDAFPSLKNFLPTPLLSSKFKMSLVYFSYTEESAVVRNNNQTTIN